MTITSNSLLAGALATYAAPSAEPAATGSIPHIPAHSLKTLSTPATSLTQPLQNLLTSFEASANVLANMRFRDRKSGKVRGRCHLVGLRPLCVASQSCGAVLPSYAVDACRRRCGAVVAADTLATAGPGCAKPPAW